MKQPLLGIVATVLIITISLALISLFSFETFSGWLSFGLMCLIPAQIAVAVLWQGKHPAWAANNRQPLRGILLIVVTALIGAVVVPVLHRTVGGGLGPSPMLVQFTVVSVVVMFWCAIMWGGWPFNAVLKNPVAAGLVTIVFSYAINALLFRVLFSYEFMSGAPVYVASLDPHGLFPAWNVLVFYVTSLSIMFLFLHFDLWPLTTSPGLMRQPTLGLVWTAVVLALGAILYLVGTRILQMDVVQFLVRVPIPFIFGTIVVLNMLQNSLFGSLTQPAKGLANAISAAVVGTGLAMLYTRLAGVVTGTLGSGLPSYESELWLASALLSVTFPFLIYHAEFLGFWPLKSD
ncbi:MAG TPA: hypothetical protein VFR18_00375 [Terriglobia bacterium]|nr:hypothetical protein [Terriglobia bacterium]